MSRSARSPAHQGSPNSDSASRCLQRCSITVGKEKCKLAIIHHTSILLSDGSCPTTAKCLRSTPSWLSLRWPNVGAFFNPGWILVLKCADRRLQRSSTPSRKSLLARLFRRMNLPLKRRQLRSEILKSAVPARAGLFRLDLIATIAKQRIWLIGAYCAGATPYVRASIPAARDGVDLRLLVPNATDIPLIRLLSRAEYRPLLESRVRVFEWNGTMLHAKTTVANGRWARVGSTSLNIASWPANCALDASFTMATNFIVRVRQSESSSAGLQAGLRADKIVCRSPIPGSGTVNFAHHKLRDSESCWRLFTGSTTVCFLNYAAA